MGQMRLGTRNLASQFEVWFASSPIFRGPYLLLIHSSMILDVFETFQCVWYLIIACLS